MISRVAQDVALILLGLLSGAMPVIGFTFIGYWQSLEPEAFLTWFATNAHRIGNVMIPLGVLATLAAIASALASWPAGAPPRTWSLCSAVLAVLVVVVYFAVHAPRNAAFERHAVQTERLAGELEIWARWHWVRVVLGLAAFWMQLLAIRSQSPPPRAR